MKDRFSLNIQSPCSENYNHFRPTNNGGFCDSCVKEVIDFTNMNSEEISNYFLTKNSKNTCGRFNSQQLASSFIKPQKNKRLGMFSGIGLLLLSFFSVTSVEAQQTDNTAESQPDNSNIETIKDKNHITIKGTVVSGEDGLPLPGASVVLQGSTIGVQTDFDGNFKFPQALKKGDVLIVSYVGTESQKIIIENRHSASNIELTIDLKMSPCIIMGKVAVKEIYKSKKN